MDFSALTPFPVRRFGGSADYDDPTLIPPGLATVARNVRYRKSSVRTRDGSRHTVTYVASTPGDITGFDVLDVLGAASLQQQIPIAFDTNGNLLRESPSGSGTVIPVVTPFTLPKSASMQTAKAYNRIFMALSDLTNPLLPPMQLDGRTGAVAPVSQNPVAAPWKSDVLYVPGDLVRSQDGRWWRCLQGSTTTGSQSAPQFPATNGQFIGSVLGGVLALTVSAVTVNGSQATLPSGNGPWYVYIQNGANATNFLGPFPISNLPTGHPQALQLTTFQVQIPADPTASTWTIYIGNAPQLSSMTQKFTVIGTATAQTFIACQFAGPVSTTPPTSVNVWTPATVTDGNNAQWEEWTPACANRLPAPDISSSLIAVTNSPNQGTFAAGLDVYIKLAYRINLGESPQSAPLVYSGTLANDAVVIKFGTAGGGLFLPRWIAEINLQPNFFQPVQLDVWVATVTAGAASPADTAYKLYTDTQSLGSSIVVGAGTGSGGGSPLGAGPTSATGNYANLSSAYDGNLQTAAVGSVFGNAPTASAVWSGFTPGQALNKSLYIKSQASISGQVGSPIGPGGGGGGGGGAIVTLLYSLDGGASWHSVYTVSQNRSATVDQIALPNGTALANVQIKATAHGWRFGSARHSIFEIWIAATTSGGASATSGSSGGGVFGTAYILPWLAPAFFVGETGTRRMIVLRGDLELSLSPVDPDSAIAVSFQGQSVANIITISRDSSGNMEATVDDSTPFAAGQTIQVIGCVGDQTLNGTYVVASVTMTLQPQGVVSFTSTVLTASNDDSGSLVLPAQAPPVAFLPTGGPYAKQYLAAFTVVGADKGGPYFYSSDSDPEGSIYSSIHRMQGGTEVTQNIVQLTRWAGYTQVQVADITGFASGQKVKIQGTLSTPGNEGDFILTAVEPIQGQAPAGYVYYVNPNNGTVGPVTGGTITVFVGQEGAVQAKLVDASKFAPGQYVRVYGASNPQFDGLTQVAAVKGDIVTLALDVAGTSVGGLLIVVQKLPTVSAAAAQPITSVTRDGAGNITAAVPDVGGYCPGQVINVAGVLDSSFNGIGELVSVVVNSDGVSGSLLWFQPWTTGLSPAVSSGGTIVACPHPTINFDDNSLSSEVDNDVTEQLTAIPAPQSLDISYLPSVDMVAYVTGKDSLVYFSNQTDPGNIQSPDGILGVATSNGKKTVCVREMISGEIIVCKQDGGYAITPGSSPASQWGVSKRWDKHGPCGPRAAAVGPDFMIIFDENSGPYRYHNGECIAVGLEKQATWDRLNKSAKEQVWIEIDDDRKEIYIGVPLDCSWVPNIEMTLNYFNGWNEPLMLTLTGEEMPDPHGRRWSENDRSARLGRRLKRDLVVSVDRRINHQQMLYGMVSDGTTNEYIDMTVPDVFDDNGKGIDSQYIPAYASSPNHEVMKWTAVKGRIAGSGLVNLTPQTEEADSDYQTVSIDLTDEDLDATEPLG